MTSSAPEGEATSVSGIWQPYIPGLTNCVMGGNAAQLDVLHANPLLKVFRMGNTSHRLEFVFDYYGIRYHLLLEYNRQVQHCVENELLKAVADEVINSRDFEEAISNTWKCLDMFWPFVAEDSLLRERNTKAEATLRTRFQRKESINIKVSSHADGTIHKASRNERCLYPLSEPIINPCPKHVPLYDMKEIELVKEVWSNVFRAKIGNNVVCLKTAPAGDLKSEITALMKVSHHPNIIDPLIGVVSAEKGYVDKFLIPFIDGKRLRMIREATKDQKEAWEGQLVDAVCCLHSAGLTWGDAAPRNVMIEEKTGKAVIIDLVNSNFDGDQQDNTVFENARKKDLEELQLLVANIQRIKLRPEEERKESTM